MKDDCKYCTEMKDAWDNVESKLQGTGISYKKININESKYKKLKDNFNFKTDPHIVKINDDGTRDIFDGDRTCDEILEWIKKGF